MPSPDGRRIAYALAPSGSEQDVLYVLDVASGATLPDSITRLEAAYTPPMWLPDGSGFFYSRRRDLPAEAPAIEGYRLTKAYLHRLGTPVERDPLVFARGQWANVSMSEEDFPSLVLTPSSPWMVGQIKHGDANQLTLYAARLDALVAAAAARAQGHNAASPWERVCDVPDSVTDFAMHGEMITLLTARRAPRFQLVRTPLPQPDMERAEVLVPPGERVVTSVAPEGRAYIGFRRGGTLSRALGHAHGARLEPLTPDGYESGSVASATALDGMLVGTASWTAGTYAYDPRARPPTPGSFRLEVRRSAGVETDGRVPSHDGVMVPLTLRNRRGISRDGRNPTLLSAMAPTGRPERGVRPGADGVARTRRHPRDRARARRRRAGRSGTWRGEAHETEHGGFHRRRVPDPEVHLPRFLAGQGGSAGKSDRPRGHRAPDLFSHCSTSATRCDPHGDDDQRVNIQEFGTVTKEAEFCALLEMSAYHHVRDGVKYPAVLVSHGINDPRVEPWESAKMVARMQAATGSGKPVLFRVDYRSGHGIGSTRAQGHALSADRYVFLLWRMGLVKPLP